MGRKELNTINDIWTEEMENDGYHQFMIYEPFSEDYWKQDVKIVLCNLETYDESVTGILDIDIFKKWLKSGSRTIKNSSIFIVALQKYLSNKSLTEEDLKDLYHDDEMLLEFINNIVYMNLRKDANSTSKEDTQAIHEFLDPNFTHKNNSHNIRNFKELFEALEADIFIISGETGADIIHKIYKDEIDLVYDNFAYLNNTLIVSCAHPASQKFNYNYMNEKAKEIASKYLEHKKL